MSEILTDQTILRQKSEPTTRGELDGILRELFDSIPRDSLGLSAPQVGLFKRVFLANLSPGYLAFINPEITWTSSDDIPSEEGCLSLPDVTRCVNRHSQIIVKADTLVKIPSLTVYAPFEFEDNPDPIRLKDRDARIVQHEIDHLNGILLIDLPQSQTSGQKIRQRDANRKERIEAKRRKQMITPIASSPSQKINAKKAVKLKKIEQKKKRLARTVKRQNKIRVKIQERYRAEKEGLLSDASTESKEPSKTQNEDKTS